MCLNDYQRNDSSLLNEHRRTVTICQVASEQTTTVLEQGPLDYETKGNVWLKWTAPHLSKKKTQQISISTSYQLWSVYMNSSVYQSILESNTITFVQHLQLDWNWALQQETEPKLSSNSTTKLLKRKKEIKVLQMSRPQSNWNSVAEP